ncbi:hypothetical protein MIND_00734100 [Mycena indigotica]|uniref:Uncharacterized protein n=1 Tax=Mycena indigotica TaxID=2126181 RepID=A0A8H6SLN0_9AGAR|nr:uncharacterized protein MIND_00734100 [Mycena indigotica]KAF7301686.1 hypothetical protein MIND_00734100 [Mycena indigotica]
MADLPQSTPSVAQPTDYSHFVLQAVKTGSKEGGLDQAVVRTALSLCASFLITDTSTNEMTRGSQTWFTGLNQLVDLLVALHARDELEVDTFNAASKVRVGPCVFFLPHFVRHAQSAGRLLGLGGA